MHTKDFLASELRKANLHDIAVKAEAGFYHDFFSELPFPGIQLAKDLKQAGTSEALDLLDRHINGEFDSSKEESAEWVRSSEAREAIEYLIKRPV